jgi:hypothetical protein
VRSSSCFTRRSINSSFFPEWGRPFFCKRSIYITINKRISSRIKETYLEAP